MNRFNTLCLVLVLLSAVVAFSGGPAQVGPFMLSNGSNAQNTASMSTNLLKVGNGAYASSIASTVAPIIASPTFTGSAAFDTNTLIINAASHVVGIGGSPYNDGTNKLQVFGPASVSGGLTMAGISSIWQTTATTTFPCGPVLMTGPSVSATNGLVGIEFRGYHDGAGNTPEAFLGFKTTSRTNRERGSLVFMTRDETTDTAPEERMSISADGNILIATTTDDATNKLQVFGGASMTNIIHGNATCSGFIDFGAGIATPALVIGRVFKNSTDKNFYIASGTTWWKLNTTNVP